MVNRRERRRLQLAKTLIDSVLLQEKSRETRRDSRPPSRQEPPPERDRRTGNYSEWRSWDLATHPNFPERPRDVLTVREDDDPNVIARVFYKNNPDTEWVGLKFVGRNDYQLRVGGKYGIHRNGRPISVWVEGDADAEVQGIEVDGYGGTFVKNLVVDDLAVRKRKGAKACVEDRMASGKWWFRKWRPRQNVYEAKARTNYNGAKWALKPSDGVEQLVVVDSPRVIDPLLSAYPMWWEHYGYFTGVRRYWLVNSDISGGNRTGEQSNTPRAGNEEKWPWIAGDVSVVIDCNIEVGLEWDHDDGGSALTEWEQAVGSKGLFAGNTIKTRYGGISIAHQPGNAEQYDEYPLPHNLADEDGFVHLGEWWILDNKIHITEGTRGAISISSCRKATVAGNDIIHDGGNSLPIVVDGGFAIKSGAPRCDSGTIMIDQPGIDIGTYINGDYVIHSAYV